MTIIWETTKGFSKSVGVYREDDGSFLAMTMSASKNFKTLKGAEKFMSDRGICK